MARDRSIDDISKATCALNLDNLTWKKARGVGMWLARESQIKLETDRDSCNFFLTSFVECHEMIIAHFFLLSMF